MYPYRTREVAKIHPSTGPVRIQRLWTGCRGGPGQLSKEVLGRPVSVVELPNHGREAESYMHHILLRWDKLV